MHTETVDGICWDVEQHRYCHERLTYEVEWQDTVQTWVYFLIGRMILAPVTAC
jgi:hypothetical protein